MNATGRDKFIEELKKEYYELFEQLTPDEIKTKPIIDLSGEGQFVFILNRELIEKYKLEEWLKNYRREAEQSTGGIRGPQNILYCWDTRFPINQLGVTLATVAKALVLKEKNPGKVLHKAVSGEVRYNTDHYIELISRLQAALGITTHQPQGVSRIPVWMTSFLILMNDFDGGEYITSSHSISAKIATKDIDNEGGMFLLETTTAFVDKIDEIIDKAKSDPAGFKIILSAKSNPNIVKDLDGLDLYAEYLRGGVATSANLGLIKKAAEAGMRIMFDTVGGCMYQNLPLLFKRLNLPDIFDWHNKEEDPFFHGLGKTRRLNLQSGKEEFFDVSCDASLPEVVDTMGYDIFLEDKPVGYTLFVTDPDGDRLILGQVEGVENIPRLKDWGIIYKQIDEKRAVAMYHPAFIFLLIMDFHMRQLKSSGFWKNHPRFIITTTPCPRSWDEWAAANGIKVINTPVGIKEIAAIIKKVERQILANPDKEVIVQDIWGREINLGVNPRMVFGGEESGGMMIGPEDMVVTKGGRMILAVRDKSAGESSVIALAMTSFLYLKNKSLFEHLENIFQEYGLAHKYYLRTDLVYYNESEPDPIKLLQAKAAGEKQRDKIDLFYLGLALGLREKVIDLSRVKTILVQAMPDLDFDALENILFTGDATYFSFKNMFVQIRKSGTDAKLRGYANGDDKEKCQKYLDLLVNYSGEPTDLYKKHLSAEFISTLYNLAKKIYYKYLYTLL